MKTKRKHPFLLSTSIGLLFAVACAPQDNTSEAAPPSSPVAQTTHQASTPAGTAGLSLPEGFGANVFAEATGKARHMVVRANGDVYVRLRSAEQGHCNVALRDSNQDGVADEQHYFGGPDCGTGMALKEPYLYTSSREKVYRTRLDDALVPTAAAEVVVSELGAPATHDARALTLDDAGFLYVNVGAPSNACQSNDRKKGSPGQDPCPLLQEFAGIYRFKADALNQTKASGIRFASGIRNAVALDWNPTDQKLYALQHGRDQLHSLYPDTFSVEDNAQKPAEEYAAFSQGDDLGWPYCYYDPQRKQKVLAPEYGGDGQTIGRCSDFTQPIIGFPAHYAPNDLLFYQGSSFPDKYQQGAFIAFHGSWNRAPLPQEGYQVVFAKNGEWDIFADGFAGSAAKKASGQAEHRPMGLAETPEGHLLVVDSMEGKIWRIFIKKTLKVD